MGIRHILLTTDFSENARLTYATAAAIAKSFGAEIMLVHFADLSEAISKNNRDVFYESLTEALSKESQRSEFDEVSCRAELLTHRFSPGKLRTLESNESIDLVVLGTHGRSGVGRFVLGSFAERVVRNSSRPVLAVHASHRTFDPSVIVVPFDDSDSARATIPIINDLASMTSCSVHFLHVDEPQAKRKYHFLQVVDLVAESRKAAEKLYEEFQQTDLNGINTNFVTRAGLVADTIVDFAKESEADLIVLGTQGVLGSVAQNVTRQATCPVLTVPRPNAHPDV